MCGQPRPPPTDQLNLPPPPSVGDDAFDGNWDHASSVSGGSNRAKSGSVISLNFGGVRSRVKSLQVSAQQAVTSVTSSQAINSLQGGLQSAKDKVAQVLAIDRDSEEWDSDDEVCAAIPLRRGFARCRCVHVLYPTAPNLRYRLPFLLHF